MESGEAGYSPYVDEDPRFPDWYDVSDEERNFCSTYSGAYEAQSYYEDSGLSAEEYPVSKLTMTLQGQRTVQYDNFLYEIAWYVHPLAEDITYTIKLIGDDNEELYTGYATALDGEAGYEAFESEVEYESVQLILESGETPLEVEIIEK